MARELFGARGVARTPMRRALPTCLLLLSLGCARVPPPVAPPVAFAAGDVAARPIEIGEASEGGADEGESAADDGDDTLRLCAPDTPEMRAAENAVESLAERIRGLDRGAKPKAVAALEKEIASVLDTTCFEIARQDLGGALHFTSATSLKAWWDRGGETFLRSYFALADNRFGYVAPTPRRALTLEGNAQHALAPLLCPASALDDGSCGNETRGWIRRAESTFGRIRAAGARANEDACVEAAKKAEKAARYSTLRECMDSAAPAGTALPLGRFKPMTDGWLVMVGDQPTGACNDLRAYDLATGSAYVVHCRGDVEVGRVPLGALREAAFLLMLVSATEDDVRPSEHGFSIDETIPLTRRAPRGLSIRGYGICGGSSTRRAFSWMQSDGAKIWKGRMAGTIALSASFPAGAAHAAELLAIAESGFEKGCAPAPPPAAVAWDRPGTALYGDAPDFARATTPAQRDALARARTTRCAILP